MTVLQSIAGDGAGADEPLIDVVTEDVAGGGGAGTDALDDPMLANGAEQTVEMVEVYDEDGNGVLMTLDEYHAMYGDSATVFDSADGGGSSGLGGGMPHLHASDGLSEHAGGAHGVGDGGFTATGLTDHDPFEEQQAVSSVCTHECTHTFAV
jgi:hypothetical protein